MIEFTSEEDALFLQITDAGLAQAGFSAKTATVSDDDAKGLAAEYLRACTQARTMWLLIEKLGITEKATAFFPELRAEALRRGPETLSEMAEMISNGNKN